MVLEVVDGDHTTGLLDELSVLVDATGSSRLLVNLADLENVLKAIEGNLDDLVVHRLEEVTHGLDAALANEVADLVGLRETTGSSVGNGPACLLLGLEIGVLENVDERGDDVGVNDSLDLVGRASGDVRDGPAGLFPDTVLRGGKQAEERGESSRRDDNLGLEVVSGDNVSNGAERWGLDGGGRVHQEVDKAAADTRLDNSLDLVVGSVREV